MPQPIHNINHNNNEAMTERRGLVLTEGDVQAIADALYEKSSQHACRFDGISRDDMVEAIKFAKKMNNIFDNSKSIVGKTVLTVMVAAALGIMFTGFLSEIITRIAQK